MKNENEPIRVILPDGDVMEVPRNTTLLEVAGRIGARLKKAALAGKVNGVLRDLSFPLGEDASVEILTQDTPEALEVLRHSAAHLMAQAVKRRFPEAKLAIGPVIEDGFYYDLELEQPLTEQDLLAIEREMDAVAAENLPVVRSEVPREKALAEARAREDTYKAELLEEMEDETVSFYTQGEFTDLCRGPHVPSTGRIRAFKLLGTAGAYWRGDSNNKMLTRIYGTAFFSQKELEEHLARLEEAKKRDHRRLGKELDLFSFHPEAPASPFFHPKGAFLYNTLVDHIRGLYREYGYQEVITPQILSVDLWLRSGHYENYRENMFFTHIEDREYAVKPMNCPGHALLFGAKVRSYRELPLRLADFGRLHRYELSGVTAGLTRVRSFSQDDGHIFCTPAQIEEEVEALIRMYLETYDLFGFEDCMIYLSTRPEKSIGSDAMWERAESALGKVLEASGRAFRVDAGAGVFYGPKIDFKVHDAMRREWQLGTIQLDFSMPERFDLHYIASSGERARPVMIHRAMLGSIERFLGVFIEHTGGDFPLWLAPVQVRIIGVSDSQKEYCEKLAREMRARGFRVETDARNETMGHKIRDATLEKIPYMVIIGDREIRDSTVSLRERRAGDRGNMTPEALFSLLEGEVREKRRPVGFSG